MNPDYKAKIDEFQKAFNGSIKSLEFCVQLETFKGVVRLGTLQGRVTGKSLKLLLRPRCKAEGNATVLESTLQNGG